MTAKRRRLNLSGEPMDSAASADALRALRIVRRKALRKRFHLRRFKQIYGYESDLGAEWYAEVAGDRKLSVTVWQAMGEDNVEIANRDCNEVILVLGRDIVYGVSWIGNWPN